MNNINTITDEYTDGYIDSIKLRLDYISKEQRDTVFNNLITFIKTTTIVAPIYDKENSTKYCQVVNLNSSNTTISAISKNSYTASFISTYTITISFFGLKRYNKTIDDKSLILLKYISAYINTNNIPCSITQVDVATDMPSYMINILVVCVNRKSRKQYHSLGDYNDDNSTIQPYNSTYYIEKTESTKKRKNIIKQAYLYDKRKKEIIKANNDIGYDVARFEMKLQSRFFLKKNLSVATLLEELKDYKVFYFKDITKKNSFINRYNKANSNKHRNKLVDSLSLTTPTVRTKMDNIGDMIRMVSTIKLDGKGGFIETKKEDYLSMLSKFNNK